MIYACFGHHDCRDTIRPVIMEQIKDIICRDPECEFLVGHQGRFDELTTSVLKELSREYPDLNYSVVLAYHPSEVKLVVEVPPEHTIYPEGLEKAPRRYAISKRNDWMLKEADAVICYITHWYGGAAKFVEKAGKMEILVVNMAEE